MDKAIIEKVQSFGFDVYMRNEGDTWLLFTDGARIGKLELSRLEGVTLATVHKPNTTSGTGFGMGQGVNNFTKSDLENCFALAPHWADGRSIKSVVKYKNMDEYRNTDSFNREYKLVGKA